jgi:zinc transporter ZupT
VVLVGLLGLAYASFLFMRIILLFMLTCKNLLVKSPIGEMLVKSPLYGDVSEKPMMGMSYPFSAGTLTFIKTIETFVEILRHRFFSFGRTIRMSCIIQTPDQ